ncbi:MAG: hypothetical protein FWD50_01605, partial [Betaproteobacteria bacterium]|nr:hypothetical protein [Betaproteobacteria bacterium]
MSDKFDAHADLVCSQLHAPYFRLNLDAESLRKTKIHWSMHGFEIEANSQAVSSEDVKCVWVRRAFVELSLAEANSNDLGTKIWKGEWDRCLIGLYQFLGDM